MTAIQTPPVHRIIVVQGIVVLLATGIVLIIHGTESAYSLLLGGLISIIPSAYFTHRMFRETGARAMGNVVSHALKGELVKLILIGAGFALVFKVVKDLDVSVLFAGFFFAHIVGMLMTMKIVRSTDIFKQ
jgi:ATP synthase protein I